MKNDLSLLRPFDLEAAKAGAPFMLAFQDGNILPRTYVGGPDVTGVLAVLDEHGALKLVTPIDYSMAPLAWVEGKPVYPGDTLYTVQYGQPMLVTGAEEHVEGKVWLQAELEQGSGCFTHPVEYSTWTKPVRKVKKEGWINIYPNAIGGTRAASDIWPSEEKADLYATSERRACIKIEWEETEQ